VKTLEIEIPLEPVPLARSRVVFRQGKVHSFTPLKTAEFQAKLREIFTQYKEYYFPIGTPIKLTEVFYRTKSHWALKAETIPARKPDLDNFLKQNDSMNKILFYDDAQVSQICAKKRWTNREYPYILIKMEVDTL
jgi:Holliday junction resolvase RusA-like endonuclease